MSLRSGRAALAALLLVALVAPGTARALPAATIQPGAAVWIGEQRCTLNLVFRGPAAQTYIGTAGHCAGAPGERAYLADGVTGFGSVAFAEHTAGNVRRLDFALIRIDEERIPAVSASVRRWGGPTGIAAEDSLVAGEPILLYGNGAGTRDTPLEGRAGVLVSHEPSQYGASIVATGGDSGSPTLVAETGEALGIAIYTNGLHPEAHAGHTFAFVLASLAERGWHVEPVTAPYPIG